MLKYQTCIRFCILVMHGYGPGPNTDYAQLDQNCSRYIYRPLQMEILAHLIQL